MVKNHYDVVVVGAGMVGISVALGLANDGLSVAIVDKSEVVSFLLDSRVEKRVSAISHTTKRFFEELNIWSDITKNRISPYYNMKICDGNINNDLYINAEDVAEHNLGHIIENDVITSSLMNSLRSTDIKIYNNTEVVEINRMSNHANIKLSSDEYIKTNLVIAADGANSQIRDYLNFPYKTSSYKQVAIVSTIELEKEHDNTAFQRFYDGKILALLPLSDKKRVSIVWSVDHDYAKYLNQLDKLKFQEELYLATEGFFGEIKQISKSYSFPLYQRKIKQYIQNNVVLIGDAAHSIHPLAGQGANLGFKDAKCLIDVVSDSFKKNRDIGSLSTLDKYQRVRLNDNNKMIIMMKMIKDIFQNNNSVVSSIRQIGFTTINKSTLLKKLIVAHAL